MSLQDSSHWWVYYRRVCCIFLPGNYTLSSLFCFSTHCSRKNWIKSVLDGLSAIISGGLGNLPGTTDFLPVIFRFSHLIIVLKKMLTFMAWITRKCGNVEEKMFCMKYMVTARIFIFWMVHDKKTQLFASTCVSQNDLMKKMPVCTYLYSYSTKSWV